MLLPILKPALLLPLFFISFLCLVASPHPPPPPPELLLPHPWAWDNPEVSDPTSPPLALSFHISSALSLPTVCQVLLVQILERESAHHILVQPTDWLLLGQVTLLGQSALSCWGQVTWWLPHHLIDSGLGVWQAPSLTSLLSNPPGRGWGKE